MKRLLVVIGLSSILLLAPATCLLADSGQASEAGLQSEETLQEIGAKEGLAIEAEDIVMQEIAEEKHHGEDHSKATLINFAWRFFNFIILLVIIYKLLAKAIGKFFAGGRESIKASLEEAVAAKERAEKRLREHSDRLDKATAEIQGIADMIKAQGLVEKEKIIEEAKKTAEKMKEDSKARMDQEFNEAINHLKAEAAELSITMAEEILKKNIKERDHEIMVDDFLDRMVNQN